MYSTLTKLAMLFLLCLLGPLTIAQQSSEAQTHFERGKQNLQSNLYDAAIEEFQQAIRLQPKWAEAYFELGLAYSAIPLKPGSNGQNLDAALKAFAEAVRLRPDWPEALVELGIKYHSFLQYDKAIASLKRAITLRPELAQAHQQLGIEYLYTGHYLDGIASLKEATRLGPEQALSHEMLGLAYLVVDERGKAFDEYRILQPLNADMAKYLDNALHNSDKPTFGVTSGKLISVPKPGYPSGAKGIAGTVTVEVSIDEQGKVTSAHAISGPMELRAAAEAAALKARFSATKLSGKRISMNGTITFSFVPQ